MKKITLAIIFLLIFKLIFIGLHHHEYQSFTDPHYNLTEKGVTCDICNAIHFDCLFIENIDIILQTNFIKVENTTLYFNNYFQTNFELRIPRAPPVMN